MASCTENATHDTVIRAHHIGSVRITEMSTRFIGASVPGPKNYIPRIEADVIDSLQVEDLREGVIWSGNLDYSGGVLVNDPENDYASIGELWIGDVGPYSDVWFRDCPLAEFTGSVLGEIHIPALEYDQIIRIDHGLATYAECGCEEFHVTNCPYPEPDSVGTYCEDSPRSPGSGSSCTEPCALSGAVRIREADGLAGQIILNAANVIDPPGDSWVGSVVVGDDGIVTSELLAPGESQPYEAPYYEKSYLDIGGGAVGVGPYHLHETACFPPHNDPDPEHAVAQGQFLESGPLYDSYYPVSIRFYGPVEPATLTLTGALKVAMYFENMETHTCQWADVTGVFKAELLDSGRTIALYSDESSMRPKTGLYRIYSEPEMLLSKYVSDDENPRDVVWPLTTFCLSGEPVAVEGYVFSIGTDCDLDGELDAYELDPPTNCVTCDCDFDDNNAVEVADLFNFLDAWFAQFPGGTPGSPSADYDNDTDVDVGDLFGFLDCWFAAFGYICGSS